MHKLYVTASELSIGTEDNRKIKHLNFQMFAGETIGMLGLFGSGRESLCRYLCGEEKRFGGSIVFHGVAAKEEYLEPFIREGIYRSQRDVSSKKEAEFEKAISISEYLFLMQPIHKNRSLWHPKKEEEQAKEAMDQVGLTLPTQLKLAALTPVEHQLLDLAQAWISKARLVLLSNDFEGYQTEEIQRLSRAMEQMKQQGITFILNTNDLKRVEYLADRVFLFRDGTIFKKLSRKDCCKAEELRTYLGEFSAKTPVPKEHKEDNGYEWTGILSGEEEKRRLFFQKGEITNLIVSEEAKKIEVLHALMGEDKNSQCILCKKELPSNWRLHKEKYRIVLVKNMTGEPELFYHMSVGENLLLPSISKLQRKGIFLPHKLPMALKRQWEQKLSSFGVPLPDDVKQLSMKEQIQLSLERWLIYHPEVLLLLEPFVHIDLECRQIIIHYLQEFTERGAAVIIISSSGRDYRETAAKQERWNDR